MSYKKEDIIKEYSDLKIYLGHQPSLTDFFKQTNISKRKLEKFFGSNAWTKLVTECGDNPNIFSRPKSDLDKILTKWGELTRELGKLPAIADWEFHKFKPSVSGISQSHNLKWSEIPSKFLEFVVHDKSNWEDVIALVPTSDDAKEINDVSNLPNSLNFSILKFIPPILKDFNQLAADEKKAHDFEKKVILLFQMLGFEMEELGQGTGRNPDGIAKETQSRYAIIIDAKARKDGYKIGTDDRIFKEYINKYSEVLHRTGYQAIYFRIVSSGFIPTNSTGLKNIKVDTNISTTLISTNSLLKLLAKKIATPRLFDLKQFQELLIEPGEIDNKVDKLLKRLM